MPSTSQRDIRSAYQTDDGSRRCHRSTQSSRPDGMGAPHEQHPKPRQRNRQFRTDLQLSRTRSSDCRLRPELRVRFRAKSCSIGHLPQQIQPAGKSLCPLFYHLPVCNLHRKVIIRALMQLASAAQWLAFIPLTTHSRSEDSIFAVSISRRTFLSVTL